jgi:hypothetical protein
VAEAGCGWGFAVMLLLGLPLALLVPSGILDDHSKPQLIPTALGSVLLGSRSTLATPSLSNPPSDTQSNTQSKGGPTPSGPIQVSRRGLQLQAPHSKCMPVATTHTLGNGAPCFTPL